MYNLIFATVSIERDGASSPGLSNTFRDDELVVIASSNAISSAPVKVEPLSDLESKETTRYIHLKSNSKHVVSLRESFAVT